MGTPAGKAAEGATEVWSYGSGDRRTTVDQCLGGWRPNYASGSASTTAPDLPTWVDICQAEAWQRSIFAATQSWES
jgi:hypothetical protein